MKFILQEKILKNNSSGEFISVLKAKPCRQAKTKYWILELKPLIKSAQPKTTTFYLFNQKTRWASRLQLEQTYYWTYKLKQTDQTYYQIQDWKLLGEPKTVKRCWKFFKECVHEPKSQKS